MTQPMKGAKEGGTSGFFKGLGKGMLGLVTRPTGGVVDFASSTLDAVKRYGREKKNKWGEMAFFSRTAQSEEIVRRARYPRHVRKDRVIRPYVPHEATGFFILNVIHSHRSISFGKKKHLFSRNYPIVMKTNTVHMLLMLSVQVILSRGYSQRARKILLDLHSFHYFRRLDV